MLIGSLVELHVGLHSCLCFSHLEKLLLKAGLTPLRYLLDSLLSVELLQIFLITITIASRHLVDQSRMFLHPRQHLDTQWIDRESSCLLNSFSTVGGSIELLFLYLMVCSSTPPGYLYLQKTNFQTPSSTDGSTPYLSRFTEGLFILPRAIRPSFLSISLSIALSFLSQTTSSHSNFDSQGFFKLFQDFLHLVSFLSLILHAFHVLKPRFWGF